MKSFDECMKFSSNYKNKQLPEKWNLLIDLYNKNFPSDGEKKIPQKIHQIWIGSEIPSYLLEYSKTLQKANPGYEYKLWTEKDADEFDFKNKELFYKAKNPGQKSDILRYAILEKFGGIYFDTDFIGYKSLDPFLHLDFFTGVAFDKAPTLFNGMIGTTPGNNLIKEANNIDNEIRDDEGMSIIETTGPYYLTRKLFKNINSVDKLLVFPLTYFYPYPNFNYDKVLGNDYKNYVQDESICVHFFEARWN
jgi:mannosyltransferase OCH1-like enzyme